MPDTMSNSIQDLEQILTCDGKTTDESAIIASIKLIGIVCSGLINTVADLKERVQDLEKSKL